MADFIRMPDGSLILTGNRPVMVPSKWDRFKAAAARVIPRFSPAPPAAPQWWIPQPAPASSSPVASVQAPATGAAPKVNPFAEVEAEAARQQALAAELGPFATRVMNSPELIEGKWFSSPIRK